MTHTHTHKEGKFYGLLFDIQRLALLALFIVGFYRSLEVSIVQLSCYQTVKKPMLSLSQRAQPCYQVIKLLSTYTFIIIKYSFSLELYAIYKVHD